MTRQSVLQTQENLSTQSDLIDFRKIARFISQFWYVFLLSLSICCVSAFFYIRYTLPTYLVTSTILIDNGDNARMTGIDSNILEGFGLRAGSQNLDNQILMLSSWTLLKSTLNELPFQVDCYKKGLLSTVSLYPVSPVKIVFGLDGDVPYNSEFEIENFNGSIFHLSTTNGSELLLDTFISYGTTLNIEEGSFTIFPANDFHYPIDYEDRLFFKFYNTEALCESFQKRLVIEPASKEGTIIKLSLEGTNKAKDVIFLNKLTEVYMRNNLDKKNHEALRIIEFIDEQLVDVSDSLLLTENQLQEFRSKNRIMDISAQAQQIIDQAVILENEKAQLTLESNYYEYLFDYLTKEDNIEVPISPATMGIEDPLLGSLMQELSGLQAEYFSSGVGERNPLQAQLQVRMKNTKQSLKETLQSISRANKMAIDENNNQIGELNIQASRLPVKERQLLGIERKFNLNNVLYTFLMQKRAEAQLQKASNVPDNELIDPARADSKPVSPNIFIVYALALILGFCIPIFILVVLDSVRKTIKTEDEIRQITDISIVGYIPHSRLSYNTVVFSEPQSRITESFRSLRARMDFYTRNTKCPLILISSTISGEGKTFTAINLASAYSLAGKRTVLVGFDLRRPSLSSSFDLSEKAGLSTYLIGKNSLGDIIYDTGFSDLHIIPSGPIPPNPGELLSSDKVKELFVYLKGKYDFIVVDSAPVGTVSDIYPITSISDATLILVKHGHTVKKFLGATLSELQSNGVSGLCLLVNGIKSKKDSYKYQYSYKYEYKSKNA